jgi:hypothetical protein
MISSDHRIQNEIKVSLPESDISINHFVGTQPSYACLTILLRGAPAVYEEA